MIATQLGRCLTGSACEFMGGINHCQCYINMSRYYVPPTFVQYDETSFYSTSYHFTFGLRDSLVVPHTIIIHPCQEFDGENTEHYFASAEKSDGFEIV